MATSSIDKEFERLKAHVKSLNELEEEKSIFV